MIYTKKERSPGDSSGKNPRAPRYDCMARISIKGFEGEAVMRNVSPGGFRMESRTHREISVHTLCSVRVDPEDGSGIQTFELEAEVRWVLSNEDGLSAGFMVPAAESGKIAPGTFESYVEYRKQGS
jgi:hypothetical protein